MATFNYPTQSATIAGGATEAKQDTMIASLAAIEADTGTLAAVDYSTEATLAALNAKVTAVDTTGKATAANQATANASLADIELNTDLKAPVDQIDTTPLLDTSSTNIPASASSPLEVVASTAAVVKKIVTVEDIGEFIGLYTGAAASEVLLCVLPLGGGEIEVNIPASTRISLRAMENAAIATGKIAINFLG